MFKSPLWVSTDLPSLSSASLAVLQNKGLIAINQDSLGKPVVLTQRFTNDNDQYAGPLANGDVAVLLVDLSNTQRSLGIYFSALNITSATVTNLWTGETAKNVNNYFTNVNAHGSVPLRLSNVVRSNAAGPTLKYFEAESATLAGNAAVASCSGCSGGKKVGYIGNGDGNTLTFNGLTTSQSYMDVRFDYINGDIGYLGGSNLNIRGASISVNGNTAVPVTFPISGYNWDVNVMKSYLVRLYGFTTSGTNSITISGLSSVSQYAPDIDRIAIVA